MTDEVYADDLAFLTIYLSKHNYLEQRPEGISTYVNANKM